MPVGPKPDGLFYSQIRFTKPSLEGLEPPTFGSVDQCSIQLSYRLLFRGGIFLSNQDLNYISTKKKLQGLKPLLFSSGDNFILQLWSDVVEVITVAGDAHNQASVLLTLFFQFLLRKHPAVFLLPQRRFFCRFYRGILFCFRHRWLSRRRPLRRGR